ncbi:pyruvate kinase [Robiginitomaculum antarcticum]|uniref:pyruvate kinase n=1 Tax=Robiginitomaculum antarcticum TaxID=437507 RepID=UPI00036012D8|nr:pyruvate kinase [Robiginitomaculum antarcticum]
MRNRLAKIVATVGPASAAPSNLELLSDVGVDVFRLNFSHGKHEGHGKVVDAIREIETRRGRPIAIVADMQGPKIRVATFSDDHIELRYGQTVTIKIGDDEGGDGVIYMPHPELLLALKPGCYLKFDDGKLSVKVTAVGKDITAIVEVPGKLGNRKGVNVIGAVLPVSAMTDKDRKDMVFALSKNVDFIALSFVQTVEDVTNAQEIIKGRAGLIVKIEKPSAVDDIEEIVRASDGVMVARGDLGVELPLEQVPVVQRRIIQVARRLGRPVIVATHMLESMIDSPTPTRAEASDVATAMYQGADAVMLSAETAVGRHPATTVAIMDRIIRAAEGDPDFWEGFKGDKINRRTTAEDAISASIHTIAHTLEAKAVFGYTSSGSTVKRIARTRPPCPIIGLTPHKHIASRMALTWGVTPIILKDPVNFDDMLGSINALAKSELGLKKGDTVLVSAGIPFGQPGTTNTLKIGVVE